MSDVPASYGVMPNGERQSIPDRYQIQSDRAHIAVRSLSAYDFVQHTYDGSRGYRDGTYLIPHPREQFYETRRESSYYVNAYRPIVDAMVIPVYNQEIERSSENDLYSKFIEDCDAAGTSLHGFMEIAVTNARLFGVTFVVMENFREQPATQQAALAERIGPYIYERIPQHVKAHTVNALGSLETIDFFERCEIIDGKERELYRHWDNVQSVLYYVRKGKDDKAEAVIVETVVHGLGVLPVIPVTGFCKTNSLRELPNPPTYDLAMLTFALFNKESQVTTLEQFQAFSLLVTSDFDASSLTIGPTTFLNCGSNAKFAPQYISPNTANITTLVANCERLKEEIYKQAGQQGVIGIKSEQSGLAKEWDFRAEESVLRKTATVAEKTEWKISELFSAYSGQDAALTLVYPSRFSPTYDSVRINDSLKIGRAHV